MSTLMLVGVLLVVIGFWTPLVADAKDTGRRVVTLSTLCLLDTEEAKTQEAVLEAIRAAAERDEPDLIVAPLTSFLSFREGREAEDLKPFSELAAKHSTYLAVAMAENAADGKTYCTSVLLGRDGRAVGTYRKTHNLPDDSTAQGEELPVFQTDFGVLGFNLSTDITFPEVCAVERMKGADILIWQHTPERFREHFQWLPMLKARAQDSHAHLITAMYADPRTYITNRHRMGMQGAAWGRSMILNRVGAPIADTGYEDGVATATVDLDKRKADPYDPWYQGENIFITNNMGDRTAFHPIAEAWEEPELPSFKKRVARIAVGYLWGENAWRDGTIPDTMLRILDQAAEVSPDLVLLSEMSAKVEDETTRSVMEMVSERARQMGAYVLIGGIGDSTQLSIARLWDRDGDLVYEEPIYWTKGFPELKVYDTDFARIGVHTCGDLMTFEIDRTLALKGAEIILDPSQMWGGDGYNNDVLLQARAVDNGCWMACARWNSSDPGLRSVIVDPYGYVLAGSHFQHEGVIHADIDFDQKKVYYAGRKADQPKRGESGIPSYYSEDIPEQLAGWREMIFSRRRPELYGIIPGNNEVIMRYRPTKGLWD